MELNLPPSLAQWWPGLSPLEQHTLAVQAGKFTILNLFDKLPWLKGGADWTAWRAFLAAVYALPMSKVEFEIYKRCTGRLEPPSVPAREAFIVAGRRGRKSAIASVIAVYEGAYRDHSPYLAPGERAEIPIISKNRKEAKKIRQYVEAILRSSKMLKPLMLRTTEETVFLATRCDISITAASVTAGRSGSVPTGVLDELAFFPTGDSANPDTEIYNGIRPAQMMFPYRKIIGLSSPYARKGLLYEKFKEHYGKDGDVLIWQADSISMHDTPEVRAETEKAYLDDPVSAAAEYGAQFREDVRQLISEEVLDACIDQGITERMGMPGVQYVAFVDPSGGSADSFALGVAHYNNGAAILDCAVEWPAPFNADHVIKEAAQVLGVYRLKQVTGDAYAGDLWAQMFNRVGVRYFTSEMDKSSIYRASVPLFNGGAIRLLDIPRLKVQLLGLDRVVSRLGREQIVHPEEGHDDLCFVAGTMVATPRGDRPIEALVAGDEVLVPGGASLVRSAGYTGNRPVITRHGLTGTSGHPVYSDGAFIPLAEAERVERLGVWSYLGWTLPRKSSSMVSAIDSWGQANTTSVNPVAMRGGSEPRACTLPSGSTPAGSRFRQAITSTTRTVIRSITALRTWSAYRLRCIIDSRSGLIARRIESFWLGFSRCVERGTALLRDWSGIDNMPASLRLGTSGSYATTAGLSFYRPRQAGYVASSGEHVPGDATKRCAHPVSAQPVYNLQVEAGVYYANGVLVHNCNAALGAAVVAMQGRRDALPMRAEPQTTEEILNNRLWDAVQRARQPKKGPNPFRRKGR